MGLVIAMRALPGSGKTTFAKQLLDQFKTEGKSVSIFSADDFFYEFGEGEYKFDWTKIPLAHGQCFKKFIEALKNGIDVAIIDNTNLQAWEISPYKLAADAYGYDFEIKDLKTDPAEAFKRQEHGVPERGFEGMYRAKEKEKLMPWWERKEYESTTGEGGKPEFREMIPTKEMEQLPLKGIAMLGRLAGIFKKAVFWEHPLERLGPVSPEDQLQKAEERLNQEMLQD